MMFDGLIEWFGDYLKHFGFRVKMMKTRTFQRDYQNLLIGNGFDDWESS